MSVSFFFLLCFLEIVIIEIKVSQDRFVYKQTSQIKKRKVYPVFVMKVLDLRSFGLY